MPAAIATTDEVCAALARLVTAARREQRITRRFTTDAKTAWDERHEEIDAKLDTWQMLGNLEETAWR